jgi:hypothetical protein
LTSCNRPWGLMFDVEGEEEGDDDDDDDDDDKEGDG